MYRKPPFESIEKIAKMYTDGMTQVEIAKMYGVTQALVSYHLLRAGVPIRKNKFHLTAKQVAAIKHPRGEDHHSFHDIPLDILVSEYQSGISSMALAAKYHVSAITIQRKLRKRGVTMRDGGFAKWQTSKDGHKVQSYYELMVDDWLFDHGIQHINQPPLPFGRNTRADFLAGDTYIEVLGLIASPKYKEKYAKKLDLYKEHGLKVICIFPSHFRRNLEVLAEYFGFLF